MQKAEMKEKSILVVYRINRRIGSLELESVLGDQSLEDSVVIRITSSDLEKLNEWFRKLANERLSSKVSLIHDIESAVKYLQKAQELLELLPQEGLNYPIRATARIQLELAHHAVSSAKEDIYVRNVK